MGMPPDLPDPTASYTSGVLDKCAYIESYSFCTPMGLGRIEGEQALVRKQARAESSCPLHSWQW